MSAYQTMRSVLSLVLVCATATLSQAQDAEAASEAASNDHWKLTLSPTYQHYFVSGNEGLFREHFWRKDGSDAGLGMEYSSVNKDGIKLEISGQGAVQSEELDLELTLSGADDQWYVNFGVENYHKYFDSEGGYFEGADPTSFSLPDELALDIGKMWFEVGFKTPNMGILERVRLRYDYGYKEGDKSTLEYSRINGKNIFPAQKNIDEHTHEITLELAGAVGETKWQDTLSLVAFDSETVRSDHQGAVGKLVAEDNDYHQVVNALTLERWINPKFKLSGGYLFVDHDGSADFWMDQQPFVGVSRAKDWRTKEIQLDQSSNLMNLNALIGPLGDLHLILGLEAEMTDMDAFGDVHLDENSGTRPITLLQPEAQFDTSTEKLTLRESMEVAYSGLARTKLYVRYQLEQTTFDLDELEIEDGDQALRRETETDRHDNRIRVGFTTNALQPLTIGGYYQKRQVSNDHDHQVDEDGLGVPSNGYSAFITNYVSESDLVSLRVSAPVTNWLRLVARWMYTGIENETLTDESALAPGTAVSNQYDSHTYSLGVVVSPSDKLYLSHTASYREVRSYSPAIDQISIERYKALTTSLLSNVTYILNEKTTLLASHEYSSNVSDEEFNAAGIPLGVDYDAQSVTLGVKHQFTPKLAGSLQLFYAYFEEDHAEEGDYEAKGLSTSLSYTF
jgi:opacity protein-like surface antigen